MGESGLLWNMTMTGNKSINVTAVWAKINSLTPEQVKALYKHLNIRDQTDLYKLLHPEGDPTRGYEESLLEFDAYRVRKALLLYIPPILVFIGTFGNMLSFIILRRKTMIKYSTYFYLAMLAIADTLVLYVGLLRLWVGEIQGMDTLNYFDWMCKSANVIGSTVSDLSVWLIIAVTVERYIVVCYPLNASTLCNTPRAKLVTGILLALFFVINAHFFWTVEIFNASHGKENITQCRAVSYFEILVTDVWPWVDICIYSCLPFFLILGLNALNIRQVLIARNKRIELQSGVAYEQRRSSHEASTKLTAMLLTISFAFLVTTLPLTICNITAGIWNERLTMDLQRVAKFKLIRTICELLMYANHSMNFFLYCATGQKFRHQLARMVCNARRSFQASHFSWITDNTPVDSSRTGKFRKNEGEVVELSSPGKSDVLTQLKWESSD